MSTGRHSGSEPTDGTQAGPAERTDGCTGWHNGACEGTSRCPPRCPRAFDADGEAYLVRESAAVDRDRLAAMYRRMDANSFGLPPDGPDRIADWLGGLHDRGWNLVAVGEEVRGHIAVVPGEEPPPTFVVFVAEPFRGLGVGTELVKQAVARSADRGHDHLRLRVERGNTRAVAVYTNVGFDAVERARTHLEMSLPLDGEAAETVRRPPAGRPE